MTSEEYKSFARKMVEDEYYAPIENRDRKIAELNAEIAKNNAQIAENAAKIAEKNAIIAELDANFARRKA